MQRELSITWFPAKWPGICRECGEPFAVDDEIGYPRGDDLSVIKERLVGRECCGGTGKISESSEVDPLVVDVDKLMPHGKSAKDSCKKCWMIHSAGQSDCE